MIEPLIKTEALKEKEMLQLKEKVNGGGKARSRYSRDGIEKATETNEKACPTCDKKNTKINTEPRRKMLTAPLAKYSTDCK